jgi:uncharacterized protein YcgI (DUF1989 family)
MTRFSVDLDRGFYERLVADAGRRTRVSEGIIAPSAGGAFAVDASQVLRITLLQGTQICDLNAWNRHDPREAFWSGRTRAFENTHLTTLHRLWSTPPRMRPLATLIADTVRHRPLPGGSAGHDCLGARCTARMWELLAGLKDHANCQTNLEHAIAPFGWAPEHVHDPLNLFMKTGVAPDDGRYYFAASDAVPGDYIELYAEIDLVVGLSSCPAGDGMSGLAVGIPVHPVGYQVYATR